MTHILVLTWLSATTLFFWIIPAKWRFSFVGISTLCFLLWHAPLSALILMAMILLTWFSTQRNDVAGFEFVAILIVLVGVLGGFKVASSVRGDDVLKGTIIPLGLAFYTLRCVHFSMERYLQRIPPQSLKDISEYLLFAPTIIIGPIHRYPDFDRDRRRHRWDAALFSEGMERIIYGLFKVIVLGNLLIGKVYSDWVWQLTVAHSRADVYFSMIGTGLLIYFQFSGASDIAVGFARLLGVRVIENFNWPFLANSLPEFWRRWHISLTSLVREYIFLGISAVTRSAWIAAVASMLAIGAWHEISIRYAIWGMYHGLGIVAWQRAEKLFPSNPDRSIGVRWAMQLAGTILTLHFVFLGFLLVRAETPSAMVEAAAFLIFGVR